MKNYYSVLGLQPNARGEYTGYSLADLEKAYRKKALKVHPDRSVDPISSKKFQDLTEAITALKDKNQREALDDAIRDDPTSLEENNDHQLYVYLPEEGMSHDAEYDLASVPISDDRRVSIRAHQPVNITKLINYTKLSSGALLNLAESDLNLGMAIAENSALCNQLNGQQRVELLFILAEQHHLSESLKTKLKAAKEEDFISACLARRDKVSLILNDYADAIPELDEKDFFKLVYQIEAVLPFYIKKYGCVISETSFLILQNKYPSRKIIEEFRSCFSQEKIERQEVLIELINDLKQRLVDGEKSIFSSFKRYKKIFGSDLVYIIFEVLKLPEFNTQESAVLKSNFLISDLLARCSVDEAVPILRKNRALMGPVWHRIMMEFYFSNEPLSRDLKNLISIFKEYNAGELFELLFVKSITFKFSRLSKETDKYKADFLYFILNFKEESGDRYSNFLSSLKKQEKWAMKILGENKIVLMALLQSTPWEELADLPWADYLSEEISFSDEELTLLPKEMQVYLAAMKEFDRYLTSRTEIETSEYQRLIKITGIYLKLASLKTKEASIKLDILEKLSPKMSRKIGTPGFYRGYQFEFLVSNLLEGKEESLVYKTLKIVFPKFTQLVIKIINSEYSAAPEFSILKKITSYSPDFFEGYLTGAIVFKWIERAEKEKGRICLSKSLYFKLPYGHPFHQEAKEIYEACCDQPAKYNEIYNRAVALVEKLDGDFFGSELENYLHFKKIYNEKYQAYLALRNALEDEASLNQRYLENEEAVLLALVKQVTQTGLDESILDLIRERVEKFDFKLYSALIHELSKCKLFSSLECIQKEEKKISQKSFHLHLERRFFCIAERYVSESAHRISMDELFEIREVFKERIDPVITRFGLTERLRKFYSLKKLLTRAVEEKSEFFNKESQEEVSSGFLLGKISTLFSGNLLSKIKSHPEVELITSRFDFLAPENSQEYRTISSFVSRCKNQENLFSLLLSFSLEGDSFFEEKLLSLINEDKIHDDLFEFFQVENIEIYLKKLIESNKIKVETFLNFKDDKFSIFLKKMFIEMLMESNSKFDLLLSPLLSTQRVDFIIFAYNKKLLPLTNFSEKLVFFMRYPDEFKKIWQAIEGDKVRNLRMYFLYFLCLKIKSNNTWEDFDAINQSLKGVFPVEEILLNFYENNASWKIAVNLFLKTFHEKEGVLSLKNDYLFYNLEDAKNLTPYLNKLFFLCERCGFSFEGKERLSEKMKKIFSERIKFLTILTVFLAFFAILPAIFPLYFLMQEKKTFSKIEKQNESERYRLPGRSDNVSRRKVEMRSATQTDGSGNTNGPKFFKGPDSVTGAGGEPNNQGADVHPPSI